MLTFFRRIRKGLLDMGAARKYLLYAVGEILLVMIGILLALQVNNWNEGKKRQLLEMEMLESINISLQSDLDESILPAIERLKGDTSDVNKLLSFFKDYRVGDEALAKYSVGVTVLTQEFSFNPRTTAYKTLESHGFELIRDNDLRNRILEIYNREYTLMKFNVENKMSNIREYGRPISREKFKTLPQRGIGWEILDHNLYNDPVFWNYLHTAKVNDRRNLKLFENIKSKVEALIHDLNNL